MMNTPLESDAEKMNISGEIRNYSRGLPLDERIRFLNDAVKNKDVKTLRAILGAPAYLSGMNDVEQKLRTREYHRAMQPQIGSRLQALTKTRDLLLDRSRLIFEEAQKAMGGSYKEIKRIRELHNRAHDALKFENS